MKCPCGFDPSIPRITVGGVQVGIAGLEEIFQYWRAAGEDVQNLSQERIIQAIGKQNYIVPRLEAEYAEAIRGRFAAYCEKTPQR